MTFSEHLAEIDFFVGTNSTTYTTANKTRNVNRGLDRVGFLIQSADGKWSWEDTNNTDLPIGSTDIVAAQQDYSIDTTFLKVKDVYYTDENGSISLLRYEEDKNRIMTLDSRDTGIPSAYTIVGNSILLDCFPLKGTAEASSIKLTVHFARNVSYFLVTDTTKTAGFNPQFHRILSLYGAYDYAIAKGLQIANTLRQEILVMEKALKEFYSGRQEVTNKRLRVAGISQIDYL
jgi:hypothetical protein